jgi:predicted Zn-dependent peptidase
MEVRMRSLALVLLLLLALPATLYATIPEGLVQTFTLDNGMKFLVVERHEAPTVSCVIMYNVGAGDEPLGQSGMAHLIEHLMFKGSSEMGTTDWEKEKPFFDEANLETRKWIADMEASRAANPPGVFLDDEKIVQTDELTKEEATIKNILDQERKFIIKDEFWGTYDRHGGQRQNAFTGNDRTVYFVVLPANKLELWSLMESQRMDKALFREFYSERDVIMEERRRGDESDPDGRMWEALASSAFHVHPYGRPVVGYWDDLRHLSHEDVVAFYRTYYRPNNAVAIVIGDTKLDAVKQIAQKYFAPIAAGDIPKRHWTEEPPMFGHREATVVFDAQPQLSLSYRVPAIRHPDFPALQLAASILGGGESSRLNRRLVLQDRIASSAYSWCESMRDPYLFQVMCVPFKGHTVDEVGRAITEEVEKLKASGPTESELAKVKNEHHAGAVYRLESPTWLAMWLGESEQEYGDWREGYRYLDRVDAVTAPDIQRVLTKYAVFDNEVRVTLQQKEKSK